MKEKWYTIWIFHITNQQDWCYSPDDPPFNFKIPFTNWWVIKWKKIIKIKTIKKVGNDFNNWDILDGRTRSGRPVKRIAQVIDLIACTLGYVAFAAIIVVFILAWI